MYKTIKAYISFINLISFVAFIYFIRNTLSFFLHHIIFFLYFQICCHHLSFIIQIHFFCINTLFVSFISIFSTINICIVLPEFILSKKLINQFSIPICFSGCYSFVILTSILKRLFRPERNTIYAKTSMKTQTSSTNSLLFKALSSYDFQMGLLARKMRFLATN